MINEFINIFEGLNSAHGGFKKDKSKLPGKSEGTHFVRREDCFGSSSDPCLTFTKPLLFFSANPLAIA